jgi:c-di-GMP-binding flagellar brake protein YcgR
VHEFDKCLIFSNDSAKCIEGFVHEYESGVMKVYTQGKADDSLWPGLKVFTHVYNSVKGECKYIGTVDYVGFNSVKIINVSFVSSIQKRDNTRVNKQMKYRITACMRNDEKVKLEKPVDITILNISAQGICFNSIEKFDPGFRFPLVLREALRPINLMIEVVRREDYTRSFNYGCRFIGISEKDVDDIFRFVLKEQISQRRKRTFI